MKKVRFHLALKSNSCTMETMAHRHFSFHHHPFGYGIFMIILAFSLVSCSTARKKQPQIIPPPLISQERHDLIHIVGPGETLWRISKIYDVPMARITQINNLKENSLLVLGQKLRVPSALHARAVVPLYPSEKWEYIIIHHSATETGTALAFHQSHIQKGWDKGVGYHFIINNDTSGREDGQIDVSPRWIKQQDGAHCKASQMNEKGIGIAIVGNFDNERVSKGQMDSLVYLTNLLREYYKIPLKNILGHGQVPEAQTDCPGTLFPWEGFMNRIKQAARPQ